MASILAMPLPALRDKLASCSNTPTMDLNNLLTYSSFLRRVAQNPALFSQLQTQAEQPLIPARIDALWAALATDANQNDAKRCAQQLAHLRQQVLGILALRDLSGRASLSEVETAMTALAELAVAALLTPLQTDAFARFGTPRNASGQALTLLVIAMGKLGASELNVSSDIDVVYALAEHGQTEQGTDALEVFAKVAERLSRLLMDQNPAGFVFRVDTRLRPFGTAGPVVVTLDALEHYFVAHGRFWERCAWLKARLLNAEASSPDSQRLREMIQAFAFRRYSDYTTIDGLGELAAKITTERNRARSHASFGQMDVKLGRGGIREIEFIVQSQAITHGGRSPALRQPATRALLKILAAQGRMPTTISQQLDAAYVLLRRIEHGLQFAADQQTHSLPFDAEPRQQLAQLLGFSSLAQFDAELTRQRDFVAGQFEALLSPSTNAKPPALLSDRAKQWLNSARKETETIQQRFGQVLAGFDHALPCDQAFSRAARFAQTIMRRRTYLDLLLAHPVVLQRLAELINASPFAADYLTRHPILLDELIDPEMANAACDWPAFDTDLSANLASNPDPEARINALRDAHHAQVLRILARDLGGKLTLEQVSDQLSLLADKILAAALDCVWQALDFAGSPNGFAVIAYGRLGAKELGYTSDLDLVFITDAKAEQEPERVGQLTRLAQRLMSWLAMQTTSGRLFEVDTRLRPFGGAGPLVSSQTSFTAYQNSAALWEHQAITRSRFCVGDPTLGAWFEALRRQQITLSRPWSSVAASVQTMRQRVLSGHPNRSNTFDIKHDPGGLVDMEFAVQALVLTHANQHPNLSDNIGTLALAQRAANLGLVDPAVTAAACHAYRSLRSLQHSNRLRGNPSDPPSSLTTQAIRQFIQAAGLEFPDRR